MKLELLSLVLRLDCLSCVLTVISTILVGRRCWEGWVLAAANSLIICVIGLRTAQLGSFRQICFVLCSTRSTFAHGVRPKFCRPIFQDVRLKRKKTGDGASLLTCDFNTEHEGEGL